MKRLPFLAVATSLACALALACNAIIGVDLPAPDDASIGADAQADAHADAERDARDAKPDAPAPQDDDAEPLDADIDDAEFEEDVFTGTVLDASCDIFDRDACAGFDAGPDAEAAGCYWDYYQTVQCEAVRPNADFCTIEKHCPSGYGCFVNGDFDASTPGQCLTWCRPAAKDAGCEAGRRCQTQPIGDVYVGGAQLGVCL